MINQHLSIVIPFYNPPYEAFKTCLETIHMLNPLDVILVDDCSTDAAIITLAKQYENNAYLMWYDFGKYIVRGSKVFLAKTIWNLNATKLLIDIQNIIDYIIQSLNSVNNVRRSAIFGMYNFVKSLNKGHSLKKYMPILTLRLTYASCFCK